MKKLKELIIFIAAFGYLGMFVYMAFVKGNKQAQIICIATFVLIGVPVIFLKFKEKLKQNSLNIERQKSLHEIFKNQEFRISDNVKGNYLVQSTEQVIKIAYLYIYISLGLFIFISGIMVDMYFIDQTACVNSKTCLPLEYSIAFLLVMGSILITILYRFKLRWFFSKVLLSKSPPALISEKQERKMFEEIKFLEVIEKKYNYILKLLTSLFSKGKVALKNNYTLIFITKNNTRIAKFNSTDFVQINELKLEIEKILNLN